MAEGLLLKALELTLSGVNYKQGQAEIDKLRKADEVEYIKCLLKIISARESLGAQTSTLKVSACLLLKNTVRNHWETGQASLTDEAANLIKNNIIALALESASPCKEFLFETVRVIAEDQFPENWPQPLPYLLQRCIIPFIQQNLGSDITLELVANASELLAICLEKFLHAEVTQDLLLIVREILMCSQDKFSGALELATACIVNKSALTDKTVCKQTLRICLGTVRCIYYLHGIDLPAYFEDHLTTLMSVLAQYVSWANESVVKIESSLGATSLSGLQRIVIPDDVDSSMCHSIEDDPWLTDQLKSVAFQFVNLYASRYTEEYQPYIPAMVKEIVAAICALSRKSPNSTHDELFHSCTAVTDGIQALAQTLKANWDTKHDAFPDDVLNVTIGQLIPQNMKLSERDLQEIMDEPINFISNDLAGLQRAAKRESLRTLITALIKAYPKCADVITKNCEEAMKANEPLAQECASFLIGCLCLEAQTRAKGVTKIQRPDIMLAYVRTQILPKARVAPANDADVLLLSSYLKFAALFRNYIPTELLEELAKCAIPMIASENVVTHSYACHYLNMILGKRYPDNTPLVRHEVVLEDLCKCAEPLLQRVRVEPVFADNETTFSFLWKLVWTCQFKLQDYANILKAMFDLLKEHCESGGGNPKVCHFIFETIGTLLSKKQQLDEDTIANLHLFAIECLAPLLQNSSHTVACYSFQLLSALIHSLPEPQSSAGKFTAQIRGLYAPALVQCSTLILQLGVVGPAETTTSENLPSICPSLIQCITSAVKSGLLSDLITDEQLVNIVCHCDKATIQNRILKSRLNLQLCELILTWLTRACKQKQLRSVELAINEILGRSIAAVDVPRALRSERNFMLVYCCYLSAREPNYVVSPAHETWIRELVAKLSAATLNQYEKYIFCQTTTNRFQSIANAQSVVPPHETATQFLNAGQQSVASQDLDELTSASQFSGNRYNILISVPRITFQSALLTFGQSLN